MSTQQFPAGEPPVSPATQAFPASAHSTDQIPAVSPSAPNKPLYKKWWIWVIVIILIVAIGSALGGGDKDKTAAAGTPSPTTVRETTLAPPPTPTSVATTPAPVATASSQVGITLDVARKALEDQGFTVKAASDNGKAVILDSNWTVTAQSQDGNAVSLTVTKAGETAAEATADPGVPSEYKAALTKAKTYADIMEMSKAGIYDQLISEYGEAFPADAAQYAIDNLQWDWNANALAKAKSYQEQMAMSKSAIYDQLTSEYGEKFTPEEAQYAIDNLG